MILCGHKMDGLGSKGVDNRALAYKGKSDP